MDPWGVTRPENKYVFICLVYVISAFIVKDISTTGLVQVCLIVFCLLWLIRIENSVKFCQIKCGLNRPFILVPHCGFFKRNLYKFFIYLLHYILIKYFTNLFLSFSFHWVLIHYGTALLLWTLKLIINLKNSFQYYQLIIIDNWNYVFQLSIIISWVYYILVEKIEY